MKKRVYINSVGSVSAQKTFENTLFLEEITSYNDTTMGVINPNYKDYIPPAAARRMAKGIKMSTVSSKTALDEAGLDNVDAIIVGTGLGCIDDSEKFISAIIDNKEQFLTPTRFIQSSHNTVSGQIALGIGCKGYNYTYVNGATSFESCLIDAMIQLQLEEAENVLVGGVDELVPHHVNTHRLINHIKKIPVESAHLLASKTEGCVMAEGAHFFVLSEKKQASTYAELIGVRTYNILPQNQLAQTVTAFLKEHELSSDAIDLVVLGYNGDVTFDPYYDLLAKGMFADTAQAYTKHLSGEYDTAGGFAFWFASKVMRTGTLPAVAHLNKVAITKPKTILLYNQYRGEYHSLVLLRQC